MLSLTIAMNPGIRHASRTPTRTACMLRSPFDNAMLRESAREGPASRSLGVQPTRPSSSRPRAPTAFRPSERPDCLRRGGPGPRALMGLRRALGTEGRLALARLGALLLRIAEPGAGALHACQGGGGGQGAQGAQARRCARRASWAADLRGGCGECGGGRGAPRVARRRVVASARKRAPERCVHDAPLPQSTSNGRVLPHDPRS